MVNKTRPMYCVEIAPWPVTVERCFRLDFSLFMLPPVLILPVLLFFLILCIKHFCFLGNYRRYRRYPLLLGQLADCSISLLLLQRYAANDPEAPHHKALHPLLVWYSECCTLKAIHEDRYSDRVEQMDLGLLLDLTLVPQDPA